MIAEVPFTLPITRCNKLRRLHVLTNSTWDVLNNNLSAKMQKNKKDIVRHLVRFINLHLPFVDDQSRVILEARRDVPGSDYINANFIDVRHYAYYKWVCEMSILIGEANEHYNSGRCTHFCCCCCVKDSSTATSRYTAFENIPRTNWCYISHCCPVFCTG